MPYQAIHKSGTSVPLTGSFWRRQPAIACASWFLASQEWPPNKRQLPEQKRLKMFHGQLHSPPLQVSSSWMAVVIALE
eukprot:1763593-Amphidinium_carterae.2